MVVLIGLRAAGKSSLARLLCDEENYIHYEFSDTLKELRRERGMQYLRLRRFVDVIRRKEGPGFAIGCLLDGMAVGKDVVLTGLRNATDAEYLQKRSDRYQIITFYIDAPLLTRWRRVRLGHERRGLWEFAVEEWFRCRWGIRRMKEHSHVVTNTEALTVALARIKRIVAKASAS